MVQICRHDLSSLTGGCPSSGKAPLLDLTAGFWNRRGPRSLWANGPPLNHTRTKTTPAKEHAIHASHVSSYVFATFSRIARQRPGSTTGNPATKVGKPAGTKTSITPWHLRSCDIAGAHIASASVRCTQNGAFQKQFALVVTVVPDWERVLPMIEVVSEPCQGTTQAIECIR